MGEYKDRADMEEERERLGATATSSGYREELRHKTGVGSVYCISLSPATPDGDKTESKSP